MTVFLLVRHGHTPCVGRALAGRLPNVHLSDDGRMEAERTARAIRRPVHAVYSSPLERALDTAAPIAARFGLAVESRAGLQDIDFGEWTGRTLEELAPRMDWHRFNERRSAATIPGGESTAALVRRVTRELRDLRRAHPDERVVVVSHADVIKAAVFTHCGRSLDDIPHVEIATGSVTELVMPAQGLSVVRAPVRS